MALCHPGDGDHTMGAGGTLHEVGWKEATGWVSLPQLRGRQGEGGALWSSLLEAF